MLSWRGDSYTEEQVINNVYFAHRKPQDFSDRVALSLVRFLRFCMDKATGYKHNVEKPKKASDSGAVQETQPLTMTETKWLIRFVFLESVAGVPGMVGGMLRHLRSLRTLKRVSAAWVVRELG